MDFEPGEFLNVKVYHEIQIFHLLALVGLKLGIMLLYVNQWKNSFF